MGFDPRRWRPSSGSRPLTTNVEALLAENEALRREVRSLRLQLEVLLRGEADAEVPREPMAGRRWAGAGAAADPPDPWSSTARARSNRPPRPAGGSPQSRVTVGSSHGLTHDLVERWGASLASHPRWHELRLGPPGGLRALEEELRRHWWNPALTLEQELDRRCPGLGGELLEALRGPHSRWRWAVRAAFALYGPRAVEWLSEEPLRVVEDLLRRVRQLERPGGAPPPRSGTRTANTSAAGARPPAGARTAADQQRAAAGDSGSGASRGRQPPGGDRGREHRTSGAGHGHGAGDAGERRSRRTTPHAAGSRDPRAQALALLGLEPDAGAAAIKRAYRRLAKAHHPDLGGDAEAFRRLDAAYRSLL